MPYQSAQRSHRSSHSGLSNRSGASIIPPRTAVEVFDEEDQQWYKGGHVAFYNPENNQYTILWGNDETTTAEALYVRKLQVDWTRVQHPQGFRLDAKKAPYKDWLELQPAPPPPPERPEGEEEPEQTSQTAADPWVMPSRRPGAFPEFAEPVEAPAKKTAQWEKNISKYFKKQNKIAEERPRFTVPTRGTKWDSWKTNMPDLPAKKDNLKMKKYWGRFAPEEAFAADEPQPDYPHMTGRASQQHQDPNKGVKETKPAAKPSQQKAAKKSPKKEEKAEQEHATLAPPADVHAESEGDAETPEEAGLDEASAQSVGKGGSQKSSSPDRRMSSPTGEGIKSPITSPLSPSRGPAEPDQPRLPIGDVQEHADERKDLFDQLCEDGASLVTPDALEQSLLSLLGLAEIYQAGVTPARLAAKSASQISDTEDLNAIEFRALFTSLERYIALHDVYGNPDMSEDPEMDSEEFEKAIPLLSKWGIGMSDIEKEFMVDTESQITVNDFLSWAIQHGIALPAEP